MNKIHDVQRLNQTELEQNIPLSSSWHQQYRHSSYVFVGGIPYDLTEGDLEVIMSQFGILTDLRLERDVDTGKSKGFGWVKYADWRSTVLAVDNLNGTTLLGRKIGVDHCLDYRPPSPSRGKTWWEQKQKAERKKEKKEKKKKEKKKEKRAKKRERSPTAGLNLGGGLMIGGAQAGQKLVQTEDGSVFIKRE